MTTLAADHVLLDTNILLAATDEGRPDHRLALDALNEWPSQGRRATPHPKCCASISSCAPDPPR